MPELPEAIFHNPPWHALRTRHRHFAQIHGNAWRYLRAVAPFAALASADETSLRDLHSLMEPGESVWIFGDNLPAAEGLAYDATLPTLQMVLPVDTPIPPPDHAVVPLSDPAEMVALTDIAFPGFFRPRTCEMGEYFGLRSGGQLVSMGGERLMLEGYSEISGVCTHPDHRGQGLAARVVSRLVRKHRAEGVVSWLHVVASNTHAIGLYGSLGFQVARQVVLTRITASTAGISHPAK